MPRRTAPPAQMAMPARADGGQGGEPRGAAPVAFVYTGATRLVAEGTVSRRRYRFDHPGALVEVDARDAPAFAAIPHLRRRG
jgi:hypothetical protein